MIRKESLL